MRKRGQDSYVEFLLFRPRYTQATGWACLLSLPPSLPPSLPHLVRVPLHGHLSVGGFECLQVRRGGHT